MPLRNSIHKVSVLLSWGTRGESDKFIRFVSALLEPKRLFQTAGSLLPFITLSLGHLGTISPSSAFFLFSYCCLPFPPGSFPFSIPFVLSFLSMASFLPLSIFYYFPLFYFLLIFISTTLISDPVI